MFTLMAGYGLWVDRETIRLEYYHLNIIHVFCKKCPNLKPASVSAKNIKERKNCIKSLAAVALHVLSK